MQGQVGVTGLWVAKKESRFPVSLFPLPSPNSLDLGSGRKVKRPFSPCQVLAEPFYLPLNGKKRRVSASPIEKLKQANTSSARLPSSP